MSQSQDIRKYFKPATCSLNNSINSNLNNSLNSSITKKTSSNHGIILKAHSDTSYNYKPNNVNTNSNLSSSASNHFWGLDKTIPANILDIKKLEDKKDIITFEVFTDGSSIGNGSKNALGGIGAYFYNGHGLSNVSLNYYKFIKENKNYQGEKATNNVTELLAIMIAIQLINEKFKKLIELEINKGKTHRIIIYSDSEYAINCVTKWAINWQRNGWQKKTGGNLRGNQIKNLEIIKRIYGAYTSQRIKFVHVNSHLREPKNKNSVEWKLWHGNDMADRLARAGALAS